MSEAVVLRLVCGLCIGGHLSCSCNVQIRGLYPDGSSTQALQDENLWERPGLSILTGATGSSYTLWVGGALTRRQVTWE